MVCIRTPFNLETFLAKASKSQMTLSPSKRQILFAQGGPAVAVFYLLLGKAKLIVVLEQGNEAVVAIPERGAFLGESCLVGQTIRTATATTLEDSRILRIDRAVMLRMLLEHPKFAESFMSHLLVHSIRVQEDLVDQLFNSSEKRLARALLLLAHFGKEGRPEPIIAKISQETLAEMIGTIRSRVSYFMNKFRRLGFIAYKGGSSRNGGLHVYSSLLNVVLHD